MGKLAQNAGDSHAELQQLSDWKTGAMVERYALLAPGHLVKAARLDSALGSYDLAAVN